MRLPIFVHGSRFTVHRLKNSVNGQRSTVNGKSFGFTLIELLVVIGILGALTAFVLPSLRNFGQTQTLNSAADQIISDIKVTQNNSLSGKKVGFCATNSKLEGWAIGFRNSSSLNYKIYAECFSGSTWNDIPDKTISLSTEIASVVAWVNGQCFGPTCDAAILFWTNGGSRDPNQTLSENPPGPGAVSMFGRFDTISADAGGGTVLTPQQPVGGTYYNSKACIQLTDSSGNMKYILFDSFIAPFTVDTKQEAANKGYTCP